MRSAELRALGLSESKAARGPSFLHASGESLPFILSGQLSQFHRCLSFFWEVRLPIWLLCKSRELRARSETARMAGCRSEHAGRRGERNSRRKERRYTALPKDNQLREPTVQGVWRVEMRSASRHRRPERAPPL